MGLEIGNILNVEGHFDTSAKNWRLGCLSLQLTPIEIAVPTQSI
jgi:hypothetical protein